MKQLILISFLFAASFAFGQTPFTMVASHTGKGPAQLSVASLNNPWVGAKLAYNVSGDVSESFLLSARVMYIAASGDRYAFPIVGNVGLNNADSLNKDNGVSIGVFPWYQLSQNGKLVLLLHGGLNYHILDKADAGNNTEFRILGGLEAALYSPNGGSPTTLSVAPEYVLNTGGINSHTWGLSITGVVPVANGLGLLMEGGIPLDGSKSTGVKLGVIVNNMIR